MYDNLESGPNHYQLLHVRRDESLASLKKAYRGLSLGKWVIASMQSSMN